MGARLRGIGLAGLAGLAGACNPCIRGGAAARRPSPDTDCGTSALVPRWTPRLTTAANGYSQQGCGIGRARMAELARPRGVIDGVHRVLYVSRYAGDAEETGIEAIDMASGQVLWQSDSLVQPLVSTCNLLYGLGRGGSLGALGRVSAVPSMMRGDGERLEATGARLEGDTLVLGWVPGPEIASPLPGPRPPPREPSGARVSLRTGQVRRAGLCYGTAPALPPWSGDIDFRLDGDLSARPFLLVVTLQAVDRATGRLLWSRPIWRGGDSGCPA